MTWNRTLAFPSGPANFSSAACPIHAADGYWLAMSGENVEAFQRAVAAVNRGDVDGVLNELGSEVEWHPLAQVMLGGHETVYRGHEGVRQLFRELDEVTDELHPQISQIRDLGDRIVAIGRIRARGRESGAETDSPIGWVVEYDNGKMIRIRDFLDPEEALEAAGLRDQVTPHGQVELVRMLQDAWNRGDSISLADYFHPDVEFLPLRAATEGDFCGIAGIERFIADTLEVFERFEMRYELAELGERVLACGVIRVRARGSGIETDIDSGGLFEFRGGKIVRWEDFGSRAKALAAVGRRD